ncbi:MAG: hypothetical protein HQL34_01245 [Alphaproteobacteria bacterium]|nr:hypothetical protein [Alphaproteobacteria bacterium]
MGGSLYIDFDAFAGTLSAEDRERLSTTTVVFAYPVLDDNEFELVEHPVSQRILVSVMERLGCRAVPEVARLTRGDVAFSSLGRAASADYVVIHPMIGSVGLLPELVRAYRDRFPSARIVLQNSDQHQHEKLIGGPRGWTIAATLLQRIPELDWVLIGFADHALAALILGRPTAAAVGREGTGGHPLHYFRFASLPEPARPLARGAEDRSIRVQRARGCLSACTYCIEGQANRTLKSELPWDGLPVEAFVERLAEVERNGYFFVNVIDSSFEDPGRRGIRDLVRFSELATGRGLRLSFKVHLRAESVLKLGPDDLDLMKRAGIDVLVIGIESGSDVELAFYDKIADSAVSRETAARLEAFGRFCVIYGYMMISPIATLPMLREKAAFLHGIGRCWDFLNLTNRVLVMWGTALHRQLAERGLADADSPPLSGYVDYRFIDPAVEAVDAALNRLKKERPGFMRLNNVLYDALNLDSRLQNPANAAYLALAGEAFPAFRAALGARLRRLNGLYRDGFARLLDDPEAPFLPEFDPAAEAERQMDEVYACLGFVKALPEPPTTLYLHTWLSVVNRFGVSP